MAISKEFPGWAQLNFLQRPWTLAVGYILWPSVVVAKEFQVFTGILLWPFCLQFRKGFINPLAFTVGFDPTMIRYCLMHTLHLGLAHFCNGGALLCLMSFGYFSTLGFDEVIFWTTFNPVLLVRLNLLRWYSPLKIYLTTILGLAHQDNCSLQIPCGHAANAKAKEGHRQRQHFRSSSRSAMKLHGLAKHPASVYGVYIYYNIIW